MPEQAVQVEGKIDLLTLRLVELVLATWALGFKYRKIQSQTTGGYYVIEEAKSHKLYDDLLICVTFLGYVYLLSMFCIAAISGQIPKGNYVKFFQILGAVAYTLSEFLMRGGWTTITIIGSIITALLILVLLLDCFNIL